MTAYRLPLPVSTNDLVRPAFMGSLRCEGCGRPAMRRPIVRLVSTGEAKDFREQAHRRLPVEPLDGPVEVYATVYVATISSDVDNRLKSLSDALKGRLFHDDIQVAEWHVSKVVTSDDSQVGVVVEVRPADPREHPELARRLANSTHGRKVEAAKQPSLPLPKPEVKPRNPIDELLNQRINRLARSAVVSHRPPKPDEEPF